MRCHALAMPGPALGRGKAASGLQSGQFQQRWQGELFHHGTACAQGVEAALKGRRHRRLELVEHQRRGHAQPQLSQWPRASWHPALCQHFMQ